MDNEKKHGFSGPVTAFHERRLPETATPAGYAALIEALRLRVPVPRILSAIGPHHKQYERDGWRIYTPRHAPKPDLEGHLIFALKNEGIDLGILKVLFRATGPAPIEEMVRDTPTGIYARRAWFLYEWLLGSSLDLPDADKGLYAFVVDPDQQWAAPGTTSTRHRVKNNLPGTPAFCPMITWTDTLRRLTARDLQARARAAVANVPADLLARTAAFLLLKDSKSSFAIENENPLTTASSAGGAPSAKPDTVRSISTNCCGCSASSSATPALCGWDCATKAALSASTIATRACRCRSILAHAPKTFFP